MSAAALPASYRDAKQRAAASVLLRYDRYIAIDASVATSSCPWLFAGPVSGQGAATGMLSVKVYQVVA